MYQKTLEHLATTSPIDLAKKREKAVSVPYTRFVCNSICL